MPDDVAKALAENEKAISPLTIAWQRTRSSDLSAVEVTRKLNFQIPERNIGFLAPESFRQQWDGLKFYSYTLRKVVRLNENDQSPKDMVDDVFEMTFDSKKMFLGNGELRDFWWEMAREEEQHACILTACRAVIANYRVGAGPNGITFRSGKRPSAAL